jgi:NTP pyrophosphatase (non-canonical NTP hydrolase)
METNNEIRDNRTHDIDSYQEETARTASTNVDAINCCFGLIGESGEVVDTVKKQLYQGHPYDKTRDKIVDELGDVMWYICRFAACYDIKMSDVLQFNVNKLRKRYPDGFSTERSLNREVEEEKL